MASSERTPTDVDRIAEEWVDTAVELNPTLGTYIGRKEADSRFGDYSPDGLERSAEAVRVMVEASRYPFAERAAGLGEGFRGAGSEGFASGI